MNPFSDILSSTSTPAAPHRRINSIMSDWGELDAGQKVLHEGKAVSADPPDRGDEADALVDKYIELLRKNLRYKCAVGRLDPADIRHKANQLEEENRRLIESCTVVSPPVVDNSPVQHIALDDHSPNSANNGARESAEDTPWWNLKKRLGSMSIGRYSVATTRLSVAGDQRGTFYGGRSSDWRRSIESIRIRPSNRHEPSVVSSGGEDCAGNFIEFYTIGVDGSIFDGTVKPEVDIFQQAGTLHRFPNASTPCFVENISEFVFPGGKVPLYLLLDRQSSNVQVGPQFDQYQLMQFSDASGQPTYACSIIVTETVSDPSVELIKNLSLVQVQLLAAAIITKFFKGIVIFKRTIKSKVGKADPSLRRFSDFYTKPDEAGSPAKSGSVLSSFADMVMGMVASSRKNNQAQKQKQKQRAMEGSGIGTELSPTRWRAEQSAPIMKEASFAVQLALLMDDDSAASETSSRSLSSDQNGEPYSSPLRKMSSSSNFSTCSMKSSSPRVVRSNSIKCIRHAGQELASSTRLKADTSCTVVTQRAYCIVSNNPFYAFLFKLLQEISTIYRSNGLIFENNAITLHEYGLSVNSLLEVAQEVNLFKTFKSSRGFSPSHERIPKLEQRLLESISFSYKCANKGIYHFNANLKSCSQKEFVLAVLFAFVPYTVLIDISNHILQEKSLLVCGKLASLVSVITTAITYLLAPLHWDGVFVPLLPQSALEVLQAPVPYILGIASYGSHIEALIRHTETTSSGDVAILDVDATQPSKMFPTSTGDLSMSSIREDEIRSSLRILRSGLCDNRACCSRQFDLTRVVPPNDQCCLISGNDQSLTVFMNHVLFHMDKCVTRAIECIHRSIRYRHHAVLGDIQHTDTWKRYGHTDLSTGAFQYNPQRLLDHKLSIQKFQVLC